VFNDEGNYIFEIYEPLYILDQELQIYANGSFDLSFDQNDKLSKEVWVGPK